VGSPLIHSISILTLNRTSFNVPEQRFIIDLDAEQNRRPHPTKGPDQVKVVIRQTKVLRMAALGAYLNKEMAFDVHILECINFLDHLMRQQPSEQYTAIKRSFYSRGGGSRSNLDMCVEAMKGVYSSIRLCQVSE
jgi:eukaryotic translation initiation factor 2C